MAGSGPMSGEGDERPRPLLDHAHDGELLPSGDLRPTSVVEYALDADRAESGRSHELVAIGSVDVYRKRVEVFERNRLFWVEFEWQETSFVESELDLAVGELVDTFEPVELVEPVGSLHRRCGMLF